MPAAPLSSTLVRGFLLASCAKRSTPAAGTTLIVAPADDATAVHKAIPGSKSDGNGGFTIPCTTTAKVALTFSGQVYEIDPRDLLAHVCFLLLCSRTSACYALTVTPPGFWRKLLRASGLGLSTVDKDTERRCKRVAVDCAKHAWSCTDPVCGMARLEENRAC